MALERLKNMTAGASPRLKRLREYPSAQEQLDALWAWAEANGLAADGGAKTGSAAEVLARRKAVEAKYPTS